MVSICVPRHVLEVDDGFVFGMRQLCGTTPRSHAELLPCSSAGVHRCAGGVLGCGVHRSGFTLCLHALVSAGLTGVETSDLFALVVMVVEGQWVIGFLSLMNVRSMLAPGFNVLWINEPF